MEEFAPIEVSTETELVTKTYQELVDETTALMDTIKDNPQLRLDTRVAFYQKYGDAETKKGIGYGMSELGFMQWEIKRGVLNPLNDQTKPGSPWWYNVNLDFIFWSELAGKVYENQLDTVALPSMVRFWVDYIQKPDTTTWYRAHNTSITAGYEKYIDLAKKESYFEQVFINEVFYRLMYAGAMGEGIDIPFEKIGHIIFNPKIPSVNIMVNIPAFYPQNYPLTESDIDNVLYEGRDFAGQLSKVLNEYLILPGLHKLYEAAAKWLEAPVIMTYLKADEPIYPYPATTPPPKGPVTGVCQSYMALVSLEKSEVAAMLPKEMSLLPQTVSPEGEHPVFFFFNYNRLHASILPWPVFKYGELAILIPYVSYKGSLVPHAYTPILWVNSQFVAWLGHVIWKFNKLMATITTTQPMPKGPAWFTEVNKYQFTTTTTDGPVADLNCINVGSPGMFNSFSAAPILKELLNQPGIMGFNGKYMGVSVYMDYDTAEVQPASGSINIQAIPGFEPQVLSIPAITESVFGGFRINWDITLSWPEKLG